MAIRPKDFTEEITDIDAEVDLFTGVDQDGFEAQKKYDLGALAGRVKALETADIDVNNAALVSSTISSTLDASECNQTGNVVTVYCKFHNTNYATGLFEIAELPTTISNTGGAFDFIATTHESVSGESGLNMVMSGNKIYIRDAAIIDLNIEYIFNITYIAY